MSAEPWCPVCGKGHTLMACPWRPRDCASERSLSPASQQAAQGAMRSAAQQQMANVRQYDGARVGEVTYTISKREGPTDRVDTQRDGNGRVLRVLVTEGDATRYFTDAEEDLATEQKHRECMKAGGHTTDPMADKCTTCGLPGKLVRIVSMTFASRGDDAARANRLTDRAGALETELRDVKAENSDLRREVERLNRKLKGGR